MVGPKESRKDEKDLEPGTYTNQQIAEKAGGPVELVHLLLGLPEHIDQASKRSILSFAVDSSSEEVTD